MFLIGEETHRETKATPIAQKIDNSKGKRTTEGKKKRTKEIILLDD